jgi:DNA repair photolyase
MRWNELTVDEDAARTLPGYRDPAVVRTFDAPEALDTHFYEVRAKTVINRVPEASQVPFRWTINPYRGCSHACAYCAAGDTPILMADGRHQPLADLRVGDRIAGTRGSGRHRHFVQTEVRDHWSSVKPAYRVRLVDGTELITSGDHRFLSTRGWKHVRQSDVAPEQRPALSVGSRLVGSGRFAVQPEHTDDYRRGYLCGVIRGNTLAAFIPREQPLRRITDLGAVDRAWDFVATIAGMTRARMAVGGTGFVSAADYSAAAYHRYDELTTWPLSPSDGWCKGFLAGVFDVEGCYAGEVVHFATVDDSVLACVDACLRRLGFDTVVRTDIGEHGQKHALVKGDLTEQFRFLHTADPAAEGQRKFVGLAVDSSADTRVESIEPLGVAMRLYDITTGTGDFIANGVVSHNCFARPTHKYLDMNAREDFEKQIIVKVNAPEVLRAQLARPSWKGEHIALGTNTDPYQWVEGRYKLMRGIWEAMRDAANPCSILTKSPLLLRDVDLMQEIAERTSISANLSIPTLDEKAWRETEPHTPSPRARIEAVAELNRAGIPCGVLIAPLMPGINDSAEQVAEIVELCEQAGATNIGGIALHLRGEVRAIFMDWLRAKRPDLVPRYEQLYRRGAYAPKEVRDRVAELTRSSKRNWPRRYLRDRQEMEAREHARRPVIPEQPSLF